MLLIIGITGASGAIYGIRLVEILSTSKEVETHLIISEAGEKMIRHETGWEPEQVRALADVCYDINDIGAEYRAIIGSHGDSLALWNEGLDTWQPLHGASQFAYRNIPADTNVFEIGIFRTLIGDPVFSIDIVTANVQLVSTDPAAWRWDWAPNSGHATFDMSTPGLFTAPASAFWRQSSTTSSAARINNPFD